jgi:hypothetical protein
MSRGIPSQKALNAALPVAQARGEVMFFRQDPGTPCNFLINYNGGGAVVHIRRTRRLYCTIPEIIAQNIEPLDRLRLAVLSAGITREFWLWSPYGTMRFFRVEDAALIELDRQGEPLKPPAAGFAAGKRSYGQKNPVLKSGNPAFRKNELPETFPGTIAQHPFTSKPYHEQSRTYESEPAGDTEPAAPGKGDKPLAGSAAIAGERESDAGPPGEITLSVGDRMSPG